MLFLIILVTGWLALPALADGPPELVNSSNAYSFAGKVTANGSCDVTLVPAPDAAGLYSLRIRYRLTRHATNDWLDCACNPSPPLDLSASRTTRLWVRAEQPGPWITAKIVDPDNPGANHSAFEQALFQSGGAPPPRQWKAVDIPLPEAPARRDNIIYIDFYIAASNAQVPLNQDLVFYVGKFPYVPPQRAPWPPVASGGGQHLTAVWDGPLSAAGPWHLVGGPDNQTGHLAKFVDGGVEFAADADGWNEFLWSDPDKLPLAPRTTYRLQFDYVVRQQVSGGDDPMFYSLVRAANTIQQDVGWQRWNDPPATRGRRIITFITNDFPGYHLIFGIRNHGAIRIEGVRVWRVGKGGE